MGETTGGKTQYIVKNPNITLLQTACLMSLVKTTADILTEVLLLKLYEDGWADWGKESNKQKEFLSPFPFMVHFHPFFLLLTSLINIIDSC